MHIKRVDKADQTCMIMILPKDIIKEIALYVIGKNAVNYKFLHSFLKVSKIFNQIGKEVIDPSMDNYQVWKKAAFYGAFAFISQWMNDKKIDPSFDDNYAIKNASGKGHLKVVQELLKDSRVDPAVGSNHAIIWSSTNGYIEVVKELLKDPRVNPAAAENLPIQWASEYGYLEIVQELLKDSRVDPFVGGSHSALARAIKNNQVAVVKELLKDPRVNTAAENLLIQETNENVHLHIVLS